MKRVWWAMLCGLCCGASGAPLDLRYLGEIGHLGTEQDPRHTVWIAGVQITSDDGFRLRGRAKASQTWEAVLPVDGGIGFTTMWQADFDRNGRSDLLIASFFPPNGRCLDPVTLSFLLFDERGLPVPWVIHSRMPVSQKFPPVPVLPARDEHGRDGVVITDCEYGDPVRLGEDRRIIGVYGAEQGTWSLLREPAPAWEESVRHRYHFRPQDRLLPTDVRRWLDQGNRVGTEPRFVIGVEPLRLSDGEVCSGHPTVVIDASRGREIVAGSEHPGALLRRIQEHKMPVTLAGQTKPGKCSPTLIWANAGGSTAGASR